MDIYMLLGRSKILEQTESEFNGKLIVVKDLAWGVHIKGGGLTQSGGVAEKIWKTVLLKVNKQKPDVKNCLILGFGGGSIAKIVRKLYERASIKGVDIDPEIVRLGEKYLGSKETKSDVVIEDAYKFVFNQTKDSFDLICTDIYQGDRYPKVFESSEFLDRLKGILTPSGVAIFNRLYFDEKKKEADKFETILMKVFSKVDRVYPEANVMFVCRK